MIRRVLLSAAVLLLAISAFGFPEGLDTVEKDAITKRSEEKSPSQRAWDDLRWLMTAIEAYSTDNDGSYAPASAPRQGDMSALSEQLKWYYANTFPKRPTPPLVDPWGRPYQFLLSKTGKLYALYSLGPDGELEAVAADILRRVKNDEIKEEDLTERKSSKNLVVASGTVVLAPPEILQGLRPKS